MNHFVRYLLMGCAWTCFVLGCLGVFLPVLPTTPFLLLATFLFARSSERCHNWICSTGIYRNYVAAFKQAGGMPVGSKIRMLAISYAVMGTSAFFARNPIVWAILGCVAVFLLWLVFVRIPTVAPNHVHAVREATEGQ